jgi:DNA-binding GntR family transcriptional regulator
VNRAEPQIARSYLHDEAASRLRALILSGDLPPRARLNEKELSERFGVSRTPLREAFKILATEGLIELSPNRGAHVAGVSAAEIDDMIEVVAGLEATAGELACQRMADAEIAAVAALHDAMIAAHAGGDIEGYFTRNRRIHDAIMTGAANATLRDLYDRLQGRIQRARFQAHKTEAQWRRAIEDHERILSLLRARDGEALGRALREHVRSKKRIIAAAVGLDAP